MWIRIQIGLSSMLKCAAGLFKFFFYLIYSFLRVNLLSILAF